MLFFQRLIVEIFIIFAVWIILKFLDIGEWGMVLFYAIGGAVVFITVKSYLFKK